MNYPLVSVVSAYAAGLVLALWFQPPLAALFAGAFFLLVLVFVLEKVRAHLLWPLLVLTGWANFAVRTEIISRWDLRNLVASEPIQVVVRGRLADTPSQRVFLRDGVESWRTLARLNVTALASGINWQPANGPILVTTADVLPAGFFSGQEVEISGILAQPSAPVAEGLLDYRTYLRRQGIYFQLKAYSTNDWKQVSPNLAPPISDRFLGWSQATLARGLPDVDEPLKLLWAMSLGWQQARKRSGIALTCPEVSRRMAEIQRLTVDAPDVRLLSLTVDPRSDTPPALARWATRFGADSNRWLLLTGDKPSLHKLIGTSFLATDPGDPFNAMPGKFTGTERIAVVDKHGRIRAFFDGLRTETPAAVVGEIARLRVEN